MKRLLVFLLITCLLGSGFSRFVVLAGFEANQSYIAKVLCENRARPWMHCNGHCYLMKKLKEAAEKEKKQQREDQNSKIQLADLQTRFTFNFLKINVKSQYPQQVTTPPCDRVLPIFQPPRQG